MTAVVAGYKLPKWLPRMSHAKQDTLLKLLILGVASILGRLN